MSRADRELLYRHAQAIGNASRAHTPEQNTPTTKDTMALTPKLAQLIDDAHDAGFTITPRDDHRIAIEKARQYTRKRHVYEGVLIYVTETGAFNFAVRTDVDVWSANKITTIAQVRRILGLS